MHKYHSFQADPQAGQATDRRREGNREGGQLVWVCCCIPSAWRGAAAAVCSCWQLLLWLLWLVAASGRYAVVVLVVLACDAQLAKSEPCSQSAAAMTQPGQLERKRSLLRPFARTHAHAYPRLPAFACCTAPLRRQQQQQPAHCMHAPPTLMQTAPHACTYTSVAAAAVPAHIRLPACLGCCAPPPAGAACFVVCLLLLWWWWCALCAGVWLRWLLSGQAGSSSPGL